MISTALEFCETLTGRYHRLDSPGEEHGIQMTLRAEIPSVPRFLLRPVAELSGEMDAQGLADHKPVRGRLELSPFLERKLVYEITFPDNDGQNCRLFGQKDIEAAHLVQTMTTLPVSIFRGEREVARAVMRFDLRNDLLRLLRSVRFR